MDIKWYGGSAFQVKTKSASLFIDPGSSPIKLAKTDTDFKLLSLPGLDSDKSIASLTVSQPGEYEAKGAIVEAYNASLGSKEYQVDDTNVFIIRDEGITLMHLGSLNHTLSEELMQMADTVDILLIPAGNQGYLDADAAAKLVKVVEPRIVVPYHYQTTGLDVTADPQEKVVKAFGITPIETEKMTITRANLPEDTIELYILKPQI